MAETQPATSAPTTEQTAAPANGSDQKPEKLFTQAEVNEILAGRLAREKATSEKAQAEAAKKAADEAAAKNGEWQKLAEARAAELEALRPNLTALETAKAQLAEYEAVVKAQADAAKKDLPTHILSLLESLTPAKQLEWVAKNADALGKRPGHHIPSTPAPVGGVNVTADEIKKRQQIEATRVRSYT